MSGFNDGICSGRMRSYFHGFNSSIIYSKLKGMTLEFRTIVGDNFGRSGVPSKPVIFKKRKSVFSCFGTSETDDFNEISDRINAGESVEFKINVVNFYKPWPNEVNVDLVPRKEWCISWSKLAFRTG